VLCYIVRVRAAVLVLVAAACHPPAPPRPTTGAIAGRVRDQDTGTTLARAQLAIQRDGELRPTLLTAGDDGAYALERLAPGRYDVTASYAGVTIEVDKIDVVAGRRIAVDVDLPLGRPETHHIDFGDLHANDVRLYHPPHADPKACVLEGTVTDVVTRERMPGAVVTATSPALAQAIQVVTDDEGRFTIPDVPPGRYSVSAYYSVESHGTISVEHNLIDLSGGETAAVPLYLETQQ
jgi:hypothetical protein